MRRTIEAAPDLGISILTLYAFSEDNWSRPPREVSALMKLLGRYLIQETDRCVANGVRLEAIGRRDRLPRHLVNLLEEAERKTSAGERLRLRLAIDYSARQSIVEAARRASCRSHRGTVFRPGGTRRRFADPHQRRTALERFSAVGVRLRRNDLHAAAVARFRARRSRPSRGRVPAPRSAVRRSDPGQGPTHGLTPKWVGQAVSPANTRSGRVGGRNRLPTQPALHFCGAPA